MKRVRPERKLGQSITGASTLLKTMSFDGMSSDDGMDSPAMQSGIGSKSATATGHFGMKSNYLYSDSKAKAKEFLEEMKSLSKLRHPCIATIMGAVTGKDPMIVLEYMEHGSLYDLLHNETMFIEGDLLLPILRDISSGVRFLHSATPQVIHGKTI